MAEWSCFFNSYEGDRRYTAAEFSEYFKSFIGNGVMLGGDYLKVNKSYGMEIKVEVGRAFINGYHYVNKEAARTLTVNPAHVTTPRIDRVVLRLDLNQAGRRISAVIKQGTPASDPYPPTLQRDNAVWELGLADIRVNAGATEILQSNITDLRLSSTYCGIVTGLFDQPNFDNIYNQYIAKHGEFLADWQSFRGWVLQLRAETFANANQSFDDWVRRSGYSMTTTFKADGSISEQIVNKGNGSLFAERTTQFLANGQIKQIITFSEPAISCVKTTTFNASSIVEEFV